MIPFSCCPSWMDSVLGQNWVVCLNTCPGLGRCRCVAKCFCNPPWPGPTRVSLARVLKALFWSSALEGRSCPRFPVCQECFWFTTDNVVKEDRKEHFRCSGHLSGGAGKSSSSITARLPSRGTALTTAVRKNHEHSCDLKWTRYR